MPDVISGRIQKGEHLSVSTEFKKKMPSGTVWGHNLKQRVTS